MSKPIITLLTDFGVQDHMAASVKGQLLQHINEAPIIIDISHQIANYNLSQAAYILQGCIANFGTHTYHAVLVNLHHNSSQAVYCFEYKGQYIFTPNNGFIHLLVGNSALPVYAIPYISGMPYNFVNYTITMAKAINWLHAGQPIHLLGDLCTTYLQKYNVRPKETENSIEGQIIYVDKYENVVTNITQELFNRVKNGRPFKIVFKRDEIIEHLATSYGEVVPGEKLAFFNSNGYLEIAINQGNAAGLFGLVSYDHNNKATTTVIQKDIFYLTIKVYFG